MQDTMTDGRCLEPCTLTYHDVNVVYYDTTPTSKYDMGSGYFGIYAFYQNLLVKTQTEEFVYGFDSALVAVGGSMGLFLGTSCYSLCATFLDWLHDSILPWLNRRVVYF